jgi:hypothetical protein
LLQSRPALVGGQTFFANNHTVATGGGPSRSEQRFPVSNPLAPDDERASTVGWGGWWEPGEREDAETRAKAKSAMKGLAVSVIEESQLLQTRGW